VQLGGRYAALLSGAALVGDDDPLAAGSTASGAALA
jgi:hypothetical protein